MRTLEVLFTPAEFESLQHRNLGRTTCVVFDVLRATSTIVTALANGAKSVRPVRTVEQAVELRNQHPDVILAGEREGLRITAKMSGGIDFDLGNSPREFRPEIIGGKRVVMTTTNGTRAIESCAGAERVVISSFLNLQAVADFLAQQAPENLLVICSGTNEEASFEDTLGTGALCERLWNSYKGEHIADSAQIARMIYNTSQNDLMAAISHARNGRRLLAIPELRDDVEYCLRNGVYNLAPVVGQEGDIVAAYS